MPNPNPLQIVHMAELLAYQQMQIKVLQPRILRVQATLSKFLASTNIKRCIEALVAEHIQLILYVFAHLAFASMTLFWQLQHLKYDQFK